MAKKRNTQLNRFEFPNGSESSATSASSTALRARSVAVAIGFCLSLTACGAAPEQARGYETAQQIIAQVEGTAIDGDVDQAQTDNPVLALEVAGSNCERIITTDEYGFELEQVSCDEDPPEVAAAQSSTTQQAPSATDDVNSTTGSGFEATTTTASIADQPASNPDGSPLQTSRNGGARNSGTQNAGTKATATPKNPVSTRTASGQSNNTRASQTTTPNTTAIKTATNLSPPTTPTSSQPASISVDEVLAHQGFLPGNYYPALAASAPTETLRSEFSRFGSQLNTVETHCGTNLRLWLAALDQMSKTANNLATSIKADPNFPGSLQAKALARSIIERALHESGCSSPGAAALSSSESRSALTRTKAAAEAIVGLDNALRNSINGPLFHQFSTYPNYLWLRNETTPTDVVLVGSSQVGAGLDVKALNTQFNREFGSVQLPGGLAEVQQWWIPEVTSLINPSTVVWFIGPLDLFTGCDVSGRKEQYVQNHQARTKSFARNGWLANHDALDRIIGSRTPDQTVRGDAPKRPTIDPDGLNNQRSQYISQFNSFCIERAKLIQKQVQDLAAQNRRVIVVGMPVHPELTAARNGGLPGVTNEMSSFAATYLAGAEFIDLTATMQTAGPWSDLTHLTQPGSEQFTDHLIDHLYANGIR